MAMINIKWEELTAEIMTNYYLYGQATKPSAKELLDAKWIDTIEPITLNITDQASYMTAGPGRFANGSQIELIDNFFLPSVLGDTGDGQRHTYKIDWDMGRVYDVNTGETASFSGSRIQALTHSDYSDQGGQEWAERTYIYQSQAYFLHKDAVFVIEPDGERYIEGFVLMPNDEDFDFDSDSTFTQIANTLLLEPNIDPSVIGQRVEINFLTSDDDMEIAAYKTYGETHGTTYTFPNFLDDINRYSDENHGTYLGLLSPMNELMDNLWNDGTTQFIDPQGRAIVYGTNGDDSFSVLGSGPNGTHNFKEGSFMREYYSTHFQNGVAIIAGDGNDTLKGGDYNDYLEGGEGKDQLEGGEGYDIYMTGNGDTIYDSDGKGMVFVGEKFFTGGTKVCTNGDDASDAGVYMGDGGFYTWSADNKLTFTKDDFMIQFV